jgi:type VI secretion system protein ImpF
MVTARMVKKQDEKFLIPSLLDRLIDENPDSPNEPIRSRGQLMQQLKMSVRRDLENLLNTRYRCKLWPPDMEQLEVSVVDYGIPDFTGINMSLRSERENLRRIIERVIRRFEPRFESVRVALVDSANDFDRTLKFRINALLRAEPEPEPVVFDSEIEPTNASIEIKQQTR